jgi:protoheme IX farnesyltransferase
MFFWQLPHFLAIAWMCREDYARAGLPMLSVLDTHGGVTGRQAVLWGAALIPFSQLPMLVGLTGPVYGVSALLLGAAQLAVAVAFLRHRSIANARMLFFASILYLPALWAAMVLDRT